MTNDTEIDEALSRVKDGQIPHTDHNMRHWDRTCPACIAQGEQNNAAPELPQQKVSGENGKIVAAEASEQLAPNTQASAPSTALEDALRCVDELKFSSTMGRNLCHEILRALAAQLKLESDLDRITIEGLREEIGRFTRLYEAAEREVTELKYRLAEARDNALSEAIAACRIVSENPSSLWEEPGCWTHAANNCAAAIRALRAAAKADHPHDPTGKCGNTGEAGNGSPARSMRNSAK